MKSILYDKSEAVAALNRVEGFNPVELARRLEKEGQEDQLYLDVKYRKLWFRLVYPMGKIISIVRSFSENAALVEARIYLDKCDAEDNFIANAFSQKSGQRIQILERNFWNLRKRLLSDGHCQMPGLDFSLRM